MPELSIHKGWYLPKWTLEDSVYHVSFRLADSLPRTRREQIRNDRTQLQKRATSSSCSLTSDEETLYKALFSNRVEQLLNAGAGSCILSRPDIAAIMKDSLNFYNTRHYDLHVWCIMPNHVHVIVEPLPSHDLSKIVQKWKSYTAYQVNRLLDRRGALWSKDYYSRIIRNEHEYHAQMRYVWDNPEQIGQSDWAWRWLKH